MALIICPDCQASISDAAPACPRCGRPATPPAAPAVHAAPTFEQTPFELGMSRALEQSAAWLRPRLQRVRPSTWRNALLAVIAAVTCLSMWGIWTAYGPPAQRQAERDFVRAHCEDGTTFATCQAIVAKRNAEAHEVAGAVAAKERATSAVTTASPAVYETSYGNAAPRMLDNVGDVGAVTEQTSVFLRREYFDAAIARAGAEDLPGFAALSMKFAMICPKGTRVQLLEKSGIGRRVRILSGAFDGASGWMGPDSITSQ
jgi:hypothetical protein